MDKVFNLEIDGQITLPDGSKLGPLYETPIKVVQPSDGGYDELSDGNITEVEGKKVLTPLGGGVIIKQLDVEIGVTATEDGDITWGEEPIAEGELIVGETYRVTVNDVTDDYVCYVDDYDQKIINKFEDDMTAGDWQIASYGNKIVINVFGSVGDEFSFHIVGKTSSVSTISLKFIPQVFSVNYYINGDSLLIHTRYDDSGNEILLYKAPNLISPPQPTQVLGDIPLNISSIAPTSSDGFFVRSVMLEDERYIEMSGYGRTEDDAIAVAEAYGFTYETDPTN